MAIDLADFLVLFDVVVAKLPIVVGESEGLEATFFAVEPNGGHAESTVHQAAEFGPLVRCECAGHLHEAGHGGDRMPHDHVEKVFHHRLGQAELCGDPVISSCLGLETGECLPRRRARRPTFLLFELHPELSQAKQSCGGIIVADQIFLPHHLEEFGLQYIV